LEARSLRSALEVCDITPGLRVATHYLLEWSIGLWLMRMSALADRGLVSALLRGVSRSVHWLTRLETRWRIN